MPRPAGLGGVEVNTSGAREQRAGGGFLGPMTTERYDMAMQMLNAAMSGAAGSNSPALAFLTPIIGAMTGAKLAQKRDEGIASQNSEMTQALLGRQLDDQTLQAMAIMDDPNAPSYLKQIAATMVKKGLVPVGQMAAPARRGGGGRASGGGGTAAASAAPGPSGRLVGEYDVGGVIHGRDSKGVLWPYKTADGSYAGTKPNGRPAVATPAAPAMPALPADPVIPSDPAVSSNDDALIQKYLGQ